MKFNIIKLVKSGNKMKNKKYHIVGIILKLNIKIVERGKIDITNTQPFIFLVWYMCTLKFKKS
jgi:hypothetical protein